MVYSRWLEQSASFDARGPMALWKLSSPTWARPRQLHSRRTGPGTPSWNHTFTTPLISRREDMKSVGGRYPTTRNKSNPPRESALSEARTWLEWSVRASGIRKRLHSTETIHRNEELLCSPWIDNHNFPYFDYVAFIYVLRRNPEPCTVVMHNDTTSNQHGEKVRRANGYLPALKKRKKRGVQTPNTTSSTPPPPGVSQVQQEVHLLH